MVLSSALSRVSLEPKTRVSARETASDRGRVRATCRAEPRLESGDDDDEKGERASIRAEGRVAAIKMQNI